MKELFRIRKIFFSSNKKISNYEIKKDMITGSLFEVDIESSAVEITHLRLWLSLIEDFDVRSEERKIDTLPQDRV
jgi:hypothetical protein